MRKQERGGSSTVTPPKREERAIHHRGRHDSYRREERVVEVIPKPVGIMCSPLCQLFRCSKRALIVKLINGKPTPYCNWVNDICIGYKCQYASCASRYLLPDGKCLSAIKIESKSEDEFIKDLESKKPDTSLRNLLSRRGIRKDLGIEDL